MKISYDVRVDALYIEFRPLEDGCAKVRELTEDITANYGADGKIAGIEILGASQVMGDALQKIVVEVSPVREVTL